MMKKRLISLCVVAALLLSVAGFVPVSAVAAETGHAHTFDAEAIFGVSLEELSAPVLPSPDKEFTPPEAQQTPAAPETVVNTDGTVYSGTCGDNLTWELDTATGVLTISGTGEMGTYYWNTFGSSAPWYDYRSYIQTLVISDGVTSIGKAAFYLCTSMTSVSIPSSITYLGPDAFYRCDSLEAVYISDLAAWCRISFSDSYYSSAKDYRGGISNPLTYGGCLYLNGD